MDRWRRARDQFWEFPLRAPWALRLMQIQLSVIYFATLWGKLQGDLWRNGTAVSYALRVHDIHRFPTPGFVTDSVVLTELLTFGTLLLELCLAVLIWNRVLRPWVLALGVLLHLSIGFSIMVGFFTMLMLTTYLAFVPPETARSLVLSARDRWRRRRRPRASAPTAPEPPDGTERPTASTPATPRSRSSHARRWTARRWNPDGLSTPAGRERLGSPRPAEPGPIPVNGGRRRSRGRPTPAVEAGDRRSRRRDRAERPIRRRPHPQRPPDEQPGSATEEEPDADTDPRGPEHRYHFPSIRCGRSRRRVDGAGGLTRIGAFPTSPGSCRAGDSMAARSGRPSARGGARGLLDCARRDREKAVAPAGSASPCRIRVNTRRCGAEALGRPRIKLKRDLRQ